MEWIKTKNKLPQTKHYTSDGYFSDNCVCLNSAGELFVLALCEDSENLYWATENDFYDEDVEGEIIAWMPIPPCDEILKEFKEETK